MFCCLKGALDYADERSSNTSGSNISSCGSGHSAESTNQGALIFLHAGTYRGEFLVIDSDIALIGKFLSCFYLKLNHLKSNLMNYMKNDWNKVIYL